MLSRFQGGLLDGVVWDIAHHTRNGAAPDRLFVYSLMKLNTAPDPDGALAIYRS
jgi:hypothetical protein